jgi:hypothetical protein
MPFADASGAISLLLRQRADGHAIWSEERLTKLAYDAAL